MATGRTGQHGRAVLRSLAIVLWIASTLPAASTTEAAVIGPEQALSEAPARSDTGSTKAESAGRAPSDPIPRRRFPSRDRPLPGSLHDAGAATPPPVRGPRADAGLDAPGPESGTTPLIPFERIALDEIDLPRFPEAADDRPPFQREPAISETFGNTPLGSPGPRAVANHRPRAILPSAPNAPTAVTPVDAFDFQGEPLDRHAIPAPGGLGLIGLLAVAGYALRRRKTGRTGP
jgi:hypothetical protein